MQALSVSCSAPPGGEPDPPQSADLRALRAAIRGIEARHIAADAAASLIPLGIPCIDAALGGGLPRAALHEVAGASEAELAAATGFILALARAGAGPRALVWIAEEMALAESGAPYGAGLDEIGLAPERLLTVRAAHARDVLWATEETLRCRSVGAVIAEIRKDNALDAIAARRLSLAAQQQGAPALLLRSRPDAGPITAATRWVIGAARSAPAAHGTGPPACAVQLARNRFGRTGSWVVEWNRVEQRFDRATAHPQSMAQTAADRPHPAAAA